MGIIREIIIDSVFFCTLFEVILFSYPFHSPTLLERFATIMIHFTGLTEFRTDNIYT